MTNAVDCTGTERNTRTLLVVEDEALLRMDIADEFEAAGFSILQAGTADEALSILDSGAPVDLVFSDIQMPGTMDGVSLHRTVSRLFPWIPVVLTSAHPSPPFEDDLVFIPKPYLPRLVLDRVEHEMNRMDARRRGSSGRARRSLRGDLSPVPVT